MAKRRWVYCDKRSARFSFMTFGVELVKNDSINRLFGRPLPNATIWICDQFMQCSNSHAYSANALCQDENLLYIVDMFFFANEKRTFRQLVSFGEKRCDTLSINSRPICDSEFSRTFDPDHRKKCTKWPFPITTFTRNIVRCEMFS